LGVDIATASRPQHRPLRVPRAHDIHGRGQAARNEEQDTSHDEMYGTVTLAIGATPSYCTTTGTDVDVVYRLDKILFFQNYNHLKTDGEVPEEANDQP